MDSVERRDGGCGFTHSETGSHGGILSRQATPSKLHFFSGSLWLLVENGLQRGKGKRERRETVEKPSVTVGGKRLDPGSGSTQELLDG